jgi:hypothetical protein
MDEDIFVLPLPAKVYIGKVRAVRIRVRRDDYTLSTLFKAGAIAPMLRSISAAVVDQLLALRRLARRRRHVVGPHQEVPFLGTAAMTASVTRSCPKEITTSAGTAPGLRRHGSQGRAATCGSGT